MLNFVNSLNALHGQIWMFFLAFVAMMMLFYRYKDFKPTTSFIDTLNITHITVFGFMVAIMGVLVVLGGHDEFGKEVFVSGASFMGGAGAARLISSTGTTVNNLSPQTAPGSPLPPPVTVPATQPATGVDPHLKEWGTQGA